MGKSHDVIDDDLRGFIQAQRMFFVATAPLAPDGHVNVSPKNKTSIDGLPAVTWTDGDRRSDS